MRAAIEMEMVDRLSETGFTSASVTTRLAALFDAGSEVALPADSGLRMAEASVEGRQVLAVATDPALDKGVLGVAECEDFRRIIRLARQANKPLVLVIDSAGARLDAGLPIQGALRRLMTDLLDANLAGLPMIALLGHNVFGGASMLAFAASQRFYAASTVLAMSGPRVLENAGGGPLAEVRASISGLSRSRHGGNEHLLDDTLLAYASALRKWVAGLPAGPLPDSLDNERRLLRARLDAKASFLTSEFGIDVATGTLTCTGQAYIGAADALRLAALIDQADSPTNLMVDCAGHSVHMEDESLILTQYLVHLARTLRRRVKQGLDTRLRITGEISGGIYIATAGGATSVDIALGGGVRTLPKASLSSILTRPDAAISNAVSDLANYVELGVADTVCTHP